MSTPTHSSKGQSGPPRLLLGVTLLFWGGMIGHPLIGLVIAIATEAGHWTRTRWEFGEQAFYRAWQVSILLVLLAGVLVWMNSSMVNALPNTLIWLPILFFPLQFVQSYGMYRTIPLATFSMFVRKRRAHAKLHGLPFRDIQINFGNVYFTLILIASSLGSFSKSFIFFPGLALLVAWALRRQFSWRHRFAPIWALLILTFSVGGGYAGDRLIGMLYHHMVGIDHSSYSFARQTHTAIGKLGEIKQSPNIVWRLMPVQGSLPRLLRVASYNAYSNTNWTAEVPPDNGRKLVQDFVELDSIGVENPFRITGRLADGTFIAGDTATADYLPRFILRGALNPSDLLPIPSNASSVVIPAQNLEINSLGSVRIDPKHPVANAMTLWKAELSTSNGPWTVEKPTGTKCPDLGIPDHERDVIDQVAEELQLQEGTLVEKIGRLKNHFIENFTYSRYLDRPKAGSEQERDQFISIFLKTTKRGHCEYFATSTVMLLRSVGIPARYATGFAVIEMNVKTGEALVRGTHAHAWCEAWDAENGRWIDVDLTPPDWMGFETPRTPAWQGLLDWWHMLRDDILVWRSEPGNLIIAVVIIIIPLLLGVLLVGRRLWKSKRRLDPVIQRRLTRAEQLTTSLSGIEKLASRHLGPRPPGMPLGSWLLGLSSIIPHPAKLQEAVALHRAIRFDPASDSSNLDQRLSKLVIQLRDELNT